MFNKHLLKVIMGFCGMILLGLISLLIIDSLNNKATAQGTQQKSSSSILPPIKTSTTVKAHN